MNKRKILFLTGTRADFGKMKPLMLSVENCSDFECMIFATGMHVLSKYGLTIDEIYKTGFKNVHSFINHTFGEPMDLILANTISGLSRYVQENMPDLIIVHGDRVEALAGAIVGSIRNILVGHIEGGEISGTIDGFIRHAVSKLSHVHFVANPIAGKRLRQLGESEESIYVIGSPDIDIMLSKHLPDLKAVTDYYGIPFNEYAVMIFHPVTTEPQEQRQRADELVAAVLESKNNYVVIYPNNDSGCDEIFAAYESLKGNKRFRVFPSMRFEYFLTLIKNASFIIGNSSVGIREAPVYAVPSINIGNRQDNRFKHRSIIDAGHSKRDILEGIKKASTIKGLKRNYHFGKGNSAKHFMEVLLQQKLWKTPKQKKFFDIH